MVDETRKEQLRQIQEMALDHAIEEMTAAHGRGLESKEDRGDRGFLSGMAARSLGVAVRVEQFFILLNREGLQPPDDEESANKAADRLIRQARADTKDILERVGGRKG